MTDPANIDEQTAIEAALLELTSAAVIADLRDRQHSTSTSIGEIAEDMLRLLEAGEWAGRAAAVIRCPVREGARLAIRVLGERLYEIGGLQALEGAHDRLSQSDREHGEQRAAIANLAWHGIGEDGLRSGWVA